MKYLTKFSKQLLVGIFAVLAINSAHAAHIDELFVNITVDSSDGLGNFTLRYDEYFGSNGFAWNGSDWTSNYGSPYTTSISAIMSSGPGTLSGSTSVSAEFQGLVDSSGAPTAGFGASQVNTQFVNDASDASLWSDFLSFTILGFDNTATYVIDVSASDCCAVGGAQQGFSGQLQFDPTQVIDNQIPEPSILALFGMGLIGMGYYRRKKMIS